MRRGCGCARRLERSLPRGWKPPIERFLLLLHHHHLLLLLLLLLLLAWRRARPATSRVQPPCLTVDLCVANLHLPAVRRHRYLLLDRLMRPPWHLTLQQPWQQQQQQQQQKLSVRHLRVRVILTAAASVAGLSSATGRRYTSYTAWRQLERRGELSFILTFSFSKVTHLLTENINKISPLPSLPPYHHITISPPTTTTTTTTFTSQSQALERPPSLLLCRLVSPSLRCSFRPLL